MEDKTEKEKVEKQGVMKKENPPVVKEAIKRLTQQYQGIGTEKRG